jgi:phosphoribosyl 1,2-cyclic phosphodiesterase
MVQADSGKAVPGVTIHGQFPGLVPPFEEHDARQAAGYTMPQWERLHFMYRAIEVAMYRVKKRVEAEEYEASK